MQDESIRSTEDGVKGITNKGVIIKTKHFIKKFNSKKAFVIFEDLKDMFEAKHTGIVFKAIIVQRQDRFGIRLALIKEEFRIRIEEGSCVGEFTILKGKLGKGTLLEQTVDSGCLSFYFIDLDRNDFLFFFFKKVKF